MSLKNLKKLILIISSFSIIACSQGQGGGSGSKTSSDSLAYLNGGAGEWVLKVDNFTINQTNFTKDLEASLILQGATPEQIAMYANDATTKQIYADQLINSILLINKAEEEKFFETEEAKDFINLSIRNIKFQYYVTKLMADASKNIPDPTPEQAQAFFEQAKQQLTQMYGITAYNTETAPYIAQLYKNAYAQQLVERDIQDLKDKAVIERNTAVLGEASILPPQIGDTNATAIPQGTNNPAALPQQGDNLLPRTNN
ncbi:hypothetical protein OFR22_06235 [Brachyspira hyodysenteriae]|uniref:Lipoprotein n=1 Tax=Brachyspira hyodysenteriae (strain ATCC 49526 / WA1) TaxID=565034 RepID=A0A3B6V9V8_BRAHW|nr:hypothetical protein [Brachyspira hyodysenteriae]ACN83919.1 hypothetical protein BHWA1_01447 [Brachyspira hyodysenteriae WA1]AUJ49646.1 hypothetical protein BH718_01204 [Brachyspira hyodysenteriae]KLI18441.1 hypothetical protein SU44_02450 [Brachyspira hyodysenteriae]KLI19152.1 hypothetical protein SU45_00765 [Brachyspira hyodysenteriae]KLI19994.1 hypothetical protein SU46_05095 [Brachyspira hyodysenteriae]